MTLQPGQSQTKTVEIGAFPAGQYYAVAIFTTSGTATVTPQLLVKVQ